jgi:hypothetical protein
MIAESVITEREEVYFEAWANYCVTVIFSTDDLNEMETIASEVGASFDRIPSRGLHLFHPREPRSWMVLNRESTHGTIAHESWHAVRAMLEFCGAAIDNETVAYHLGFIVDRANSVRDKFLRRAVERKG